MYRGTSKNIFGVTSCLPMTSPIFGGWENSTRGDQ